MSDPLKAWREKLSYLQEQEALATATDRFTIVKQIDEAKAKIAELEAATSPADRATPAGCRVDISRIVKYAPERLIGREAETELLDNSWRKVVTHEVGRSHVLGFVALGGEGKTSMVAKWLAGLAGKDWPGCESVFAWSFYSQGSREQVAVSSDLFLAEALKFFGDPEAAGSAQGAYEKGQRLAELVGSQRSLLMLDGVEPLQYPPTSPTGSRLKDQGVESLLKGLAASSNGLCIVTTRYSLPDLDAFVGSTWHEEELKRLSREAGVELLKDCGVKGSESRPEPTPENPDALNEYERLVEDVSGHALTLQVVGQYLKRAHHGDIRRRDRVELAKADSKIHASGGFGTGHAFRAIAAYEAWLADDSEESRRELAVLRLLGLFDRPATAGCVRALLDPPVIDGLTDPLVGLPDEDWEFTLTTLSGARLASTNRDEATGELSSIDAHPLIREYFAQQLRSADRQTVEEGPSSNPQAGDGSHEEPDTSEVWRAAHRRLYEHLCETTTEGDEPTLEDLQPLYQAVAHGCHAGAVQEALYGVFVERIQRGTDSGGFYSTSKLGAFGSDLGGIACFFERPWDVVSSLLGSREEAWLLNQAAFRLRALGRLTESLEPMRAGLEAYYEQENWEAAAITAGNLSELKLSLGDVSGAVSGAERSVTYADRSGDSFQRLGKRTRLADAMHQSGRRSEAESLFREAEQMQVEREPTDPLLYSGPGFHYCDLLLGPAEREAWRATLEFRYASSLSLHQQHDTSDDRKVRNHLASRSGTKDVAEPHRTESGDKFPHSRACSAVSDRATQALKIAERNNWLLDIGLAHLTLSRAALCESLLAWLIPVSQTYDDNENGRWDLPLRKAEAAVSGLRRAGTMHVLPGGLLMRAWQRSLLSRDTGADSAQSDLDQAWEIASRGPMPLFLADIHLHRARLFGIPCRDARQSAHHRPPGDGPTPADYPWESVEHDLSEARRLIEKHGYGRRTEELEDAELALLGKTPGGLASDDC